MLGFRVIGLGFRVIGLKWTVKAENKRRLSTKWPQRTSEPVCRAVVCNSVGFGCGKTDFCCFCSAMKLDRGIETDSEFR